MLSTFNLVEPNKLLNICQSIAVLDAILSPNWEFRYYSFNSCWSESSQMASMRTGSGDELFILFSANGTYIKGYSNEASKFSVTDFVNDLPAELNEFTQEVAFSFENCSFIAWCLIGESKWSMLSTGGNDGSAELLKVYVDNPVMYKEWAEKYYNRQLSLTVIQNIYNHKPLSSEMVKLLNEDVDFEMLKPDLLEIGY